MRRSILITTFTYSPNKDGVASASTDLAEGLAERGYSVTVATGFHPERRLDADANPRVVQFRIAGSSHLRDSIRGEVQEFQNLLRRSGAEVIICQCWYMWPTDLAIPVLRRKKTPSIIVSHAFAAHQVDWHSRFPWGIGAWLGWSPYVLRLPWLLRVFDRAVFLSERRDTGRFLDHFVAYWTGYKGSRVIPNSARTFDLPAGGAFREKHRLTGQRIFLCVANYSPRKNQLMALRAFQRARLENAALVFIGSELGDYGRQLLEEEKKLRKGQLYGDVRILERIDREETLRAIAEMEVFVLSAKAETQPIVLIESMAANKPWISTNTGCVSEMPGGLVVEDEAEMVRAMERLAGDAGLRARLGGEGFAGWQQHYRRDSVLDAWEKLLAELPSRRTSD